MGKIYCGVDIGINGGLSFISDSGCLIEYHKMPTFEIDKGKVSKKTKKPISQKQIDFRALFNILEPMYKNNDVHAFIEEVTHLFGLPSSSNFRLGYSAGVVRAAFQTFGDFYLVKPRLWQKELWQEVDYVHKLTKSGAKKIDPKPTSVNTARRLYPNEEFIPKGGRKLHDGIMEATLIAEYGRRHQI